LFENSDIICVFRGSGNKKKAQETKIIEQKVNILNQQNRNFRGIGRKCGWRRAKEIQAQPEAEHQEAKHEKTTEGRRRREAQGNWKKRIQPFLIVIALLLFTFLRHDGNPSLSRKRTEHKIEQAK
jgi:hypothetical protein